MEKKLNSLVADMSYPVCIVDLDFKFIFVNKMYSKITGKTKDELIGCQKEDVFEQSICERFNNGYNKALKTGEVISEEIYTYKGYERCTIIPIKDLSEKTIAIAAIVGIERDFKKIQEQDQEIRMQKNLTRIITDLLPGVVFCKNIKGEYIYANKECEDFYAQKGIVEIIGKTDAEIIEDKELVKKFTDDDRKVINTMQPLFDETEFKDLDGKISIRETIKIPFMDDYRNISGIVGRSIDVTERKAYEEKLKYLSYTDTLTQAKNRAYFQVRDRELSEDNKFPIGIIMGDTNGLKLVNDTFGHNAGDKLLVETACILKRVSIGIGEVFRFGGDEFAILIPNASLELCNEVIESINKECKDFKSQFFNISISLGSALKENKDTDIYATLKIAEDKVYRQKLLHGKSIKSSVLDSLKLSLALKSEEKEEHNRRVSLNAVKLAKKMNLDKYVIDELAIAAELHDIGVIGISEDILFKRTALTVEEYEIVKTHCEKGYRIVNALKNGLTNVAESILHHHERWDGSGYPLGLKEKDIPLLSRIITVCDTFDVITNPRVYRDKIFTEEEALDELKRCSGTQFDPEIVEKFISLF